MNKSGFTVIELLVVVAFMVGAGVVLLFQMQRFDREQSNSQKKVAINAMYFSLEEGFYKTNQYYPESINDDTLKTLDPELLKDPDGIKIGEESSAYRYEPKNCNNGKCKSYSLRATLVNEEDFKKDSINK